MDSDYNKGICTLMFIVALFTIGKLWKQPRCLITDEWIKEMWYLCTMEFYSATKKKEILLFSGKWMELRTSSYMKLGRVRRPKAACSPSYADYRPKTNAAIYYRTWVTLRRGHTWEGYGKGRKPKT
jgi:hypothetical protein